ncbi:MAG: chromate resistance protein ChrB domain-containing protein [Candidatus Acidiferrales bacterium]
MKWITRENIKVDRVACPWLIRRFIDSGTQFLFVPEDQVLPRATADEAVPFDMPRNPELKFTHHDGLCTFEVLIREYQLQDAALDRLARIVHGADIKGEEHAAAEAPGLRAIAEGFAALGISDEQRLERGFPIYDALYAWCQKQASSEVKT